MRDTCIKSIDKLKPENKYMRFLIATIQDGIELSRVWYYGHTRSYLGISKIYIYEFYEIHEFSFYSVIINQFSSIHAFTAI